MNSHRLISASTSLLVAIFALVPASASAGSLLSGYGGPGQGNQELLGSTLLNGHSRGGGGGGGSASTGSSAGAGGEGSTPDRGGAAATGGKHASRLAGGRRQSRENSREAATQAGNDPRSDARTTVPAASGTAPGSQTLGLSGSDIVDVLIALAALVLTASRAGLK